jgi:hypothetical protein
LSAPLIIRFDPDAVAATQAHLQPILAAHASRLVPSWVHELLISFSDKESDHGLRALVPGIG